MTTATAPLTRGHREPLPAKGNDTHGHESQRATDQSPDARSDAARSRPPAGAPTAAPVLSSWPFRCGCCGQPAKTLMPFIPKDLSPTAQALWHWTFLTRVVDPSKQERLHEALALGDLARVAWLALTTRSSTPEPRRRADIPWRELHRAYIRALLALEIDWFGPGDRDHPRCDDVETPGRGRRT
jgi:hypothetical protein